MAMASAKNDPLSHGPLRKGVGGIAVPEPSSWAEIMHRQTSSNRNRPRPDAEYAMPFRETRYAKSRDEVVYNPMLQTFTDPARETVSKQREETRRISNLNQARDRQIARESQFDVLNMSDKRSGLGRSDAEVAAAALAAQAAARSAQPPPKHSAKPTFRHPLDSCYQFNIVSNLPLSQHHYTAPELRPNMDNREDPKPRLQTTTNLPRDYDVLSNRYREGHDAKVALEMEVQRRTAAKKYWETHDYDPFTCTYLDDDKEAAFQVLKAAAMEEQPMKQFYKLPPSTQRSEGFVYDITSSSTIKNAELNAKREAKQQRWLDSKKINWQRDIQMTKQGMVKQDLDEKRTVNRQSHQRYVEALAHGYSIIDHRDYTDPYTFVAPSRTMPKPTTWQSVGPTHPANREGATHLSTAERNAPLSRGSSHGVYRDMSPAMQPPDAAPPPAAARRATPPPSAPRRPSVPPTAPPPAPAAPAAHVPLGALDYERASSQQTTANTHNIVGEPLATTGPPVHIDSERKNGPLASGSVRTGGFSRLGGSQAPSSRGSLAPSFADDTQQSVGGFAARMRNPYD
jgi:hypothetical protein